jgi:hypothetical protein
MLFNYHSFAVSYNYPNLVASGYYADGDEDYGQSEEKQTFTWIAKQKIATQGHATGYDCSECKTFSQYAELNCPVDSKDKTTFTCFSCRKGLKTLYKEHSYKIL